MASSSGTSKRRRTAADTLHISDLPVGFIADVSSYLSKPSRAILALAFTSSSLWENDDLIHRLSHISTAIISSEQWDILDFEDVDKELASKLTDNDIDAILKSISAQNVLKRLKLCGCINITGIGLNPLRGSTVLEQIDISLRDKYDERKSIDSKISQEVVVPILDSIISADGCSLKHISFPYTWRVSERIESVEPFQERYNTMFMRRNNSCSHCNANMRDHEFWMTGNLLQCNICYDCLKPFCEECADEDGYQGRKTLNYCNKCCKDFCVDCIPRTECTGSNCDNNMCGCAETRQCQQCNETKCGDCLYTCHGCKRTRCNDCVSYRHCEGSDCNKSHCQDCYNGKDCDLKPCEECNSMYCNDCNLELIKRDGLECRACAPIPLMLDENARQKEEIARLRKDNEEMAKENEELREKLNTSRYDSSLDH